jgi:hypothetical protein
MKTFKESQLRMIGGLSPEDRMLPGIAEMVDLATAAVPRFKEALSMGRGCRDWLAAAKQACYRLREANSELALGFLLRKGVQVEANDWYQVADTKKWRDYCRIAGSSNLVEWYAPLYPGVIADQVPRGRNFPEGRIIGEDSSLVNRKFGYIEAIERELFDDDQTGQIRERAARLGQSMGITESLWAAYRYLGSARSYANITVPVSAYKTTDTSGNTVTGPWSTTLYGSTGNRPSTYLALGMGALKDAIHQLYNVTDPLSNKLIVNPNYLLISSQDVINADILLAPGGYPAVIGQSNVAAASNPILGGTATAAGANQGALTGFPGGWGSPNPLAKLGLKIVMERYLPDWAWGVGESGKGFVFQERDPLEIVQEATNAGTAFSADVYRFRSRRRFEVDFVAGGSRFHYLGNDGTVTGQQ